MAYAYRSITTDNYIISRSWDASSGGVARYPDVLALALGGEFITVLWALCTHTATSV